MRCAYTVTMSNIAGTRRNWEKIEDTPDSPDREWRLNSDETHHGGIFTTLCRELLDALRDPVLVLDGQTRILYVNHAAKVRFFGAARTAPMGRRYSHNLLFGAGSAMKTGDGPLEDHVLPGIPVSHPAYGRRVVVERPNAGRLHFRLDYLPVHTEMGAVAGTGVVFHDQTEDEAQRSESEWLRKELTGSRKEAERELRITKVLLEAADALGSWTQLGDIAKGLAGILIKVTAGSRSAVCSYDAETGSLTVLASAGAQGAFAIGSRWHLDDLSPAARAAAENGKSAVLDLDDVPERNRSGLANRLDMKRTLFVPLLLRERVNGVVMLDVPGEETDFATREITLVEAIAAQAAVAIENARLYEAEHRIAETLQETLVVVPKHVPGVVFSRAYESASYESGNVGGDFVDVFHARGDWVAITLGDVSGKGLDAAVITSLVRTTLRVHGVDGLPPAEVVNKTNQVVRRFTEVESFVTLWFGLLNTKTGQLRYVSAGHPPAFIVGQDATITELQCNDVLLGAFEESRYSECQAVLGRGERVVLYSDGLTEARTRLGEFLGEDGFKAMVCRHGHEPTNRLSAAVLDDVIAFSEGALRDDAALLTVEPELLTDEVASAAR